MEVNFWSGVLFEDFAKFSSFLIYKLVGFISLLEASCLKQWKKLFGKGFLRLNNACALIGFSMLSELFSEMKFLDKGKKWK